MLEALTTTEELSQVSQVSGKKLLDKEKALVDKYEEKLHPKKKVTYAS